MPHLQMPQKTIAGKRIFIQRPFSCSTLKLEQKNYAAKPLALSLHFIRRDQNHHFDLTSRIIKMCEEILKKRQRPNTTKIL